ncbi:MAG: hypothetical protein GX661_02480 [Acholeplasmataceae bacterium]|jgi:hypothetical protein|nr:hypothetical protein [Acholeplasmataceae bacterium]
MQKQIQNKQSQQNVQPDQLYAQAKEVELRTRAGGLVTRELVRQGEEIAQEFINSEKMMA